MFRWNYYVRLLRYHLLSLRGPVYIHPSTRVSPRADIRLVKGGSVVTRSIPAYSIAAGVPARVQRKRK